MANKTLVIGLSGESIFLTVDDFHKNGETLHASSINSEVGGKGYNQALALKKFGNDVFYLSSVGDDYYGKKCEDFLYKEKIDNLLVKKDLPTALATIITNKNGDNQVTVYEGATKELSEEDVLKVKNKIIDADVLLLQLEVPLLVNKKAISLCNKTKTKIIINPAPVINYDLELLQSADIITPNESEARKIFSLTDSDDIKKIIDKKEELKIKDVIVTLGEKGAIYFTEKEIYQFSTFKVEALDTTGAGDIFNAMLAHQISNSVEIKKAINLALIAATLSVKKRGVMNSIPKIIEVLKYEKN